MQETWEDLKKYFKMALKAISKRWFLFILLAIVIIILLAGFVYFLTIDDGTYKEGDWSSTNYGASQFINSTSVNSDGTISSSMTAQELWDKLIENGSRVDLYLNNPEELARLMKAEIVTQYPDTRSNPDEPINWEEVIKNEDTLQGIIKFKRTQEDGNTSTMTYVDPSTFQSYIDEYNSTGSETAKNNALTHFTLKKASSSTSASGGDLIAAGDGVMTDVSQAIVNATNTTPWPGAQYCSKWVDDVYDNAGLSAQRYNSAYEQSQHTIISTDRTAIPIGAAVYGTGSGSSGPYGHVGIYIGSGLVVDSVDGGVNTSTLEEWIGWQENVARNANNVLTDINGNQQHGWLGWGWADGDPIRGTTQDPNVNVDNSDDEKSEEEQEEEDKIKEEVEKEATVTPVDGDGYTEEYTSSAGITYKHFKQFTGSYANDTYWGGTIASHGCGPTSVAILASGLTNLNYTPRDIASQMNATYGYTSSVNLKGQMDSLGMTSEIIESPTAEIIQDNLRNGKVMLVSVNSNTIFTSTSHIMALVDIDTNGQVYVCNPGSSTTQGWYDISEIMKGCDYIVVTDAGAAGIANSTNSSEYVAVVATWKQIDTTITTNDPNVQASPPTQYSMTTTNINYEEMVAPYTMPFDLLWAFLVVSEEKEFVFDLADLVYGSDIQITIYDNLTVNTDIDNWNYTEVTKAIVDYNITAYYQGNYRYANGYNHIHDPYQEINYNTVKTVVTQTNTVSVALTRANVWIVDYRNEYTYTDSGESEQSNTVTKDNQEYPSSPNSTGTSFSCGDIEDKKQFLREQLLNNSTTSTGDTVTFFESYNVEYYVKYVNISDQITNRVSTKKYISGVPEIKEKTDKNSTEPNFVTIYNEPEHGQTRKNVNSVASWLFEIVETNDSTNRFKDVIRYLLYKASEIDYGVLEWTFDELFTMKQSTSFGEISGNTVKEQVWNYLTSAGFSDEVAAAVMGNMEVESGVDPTTIQSNGAGPAAGICQWENYNTKTGRWKQLYDYATNRGKDWTDLQSQLDYLMTELEDQFSAYTGHGRYYYDNGEWCWWPDAMTVEEYKMLTDIDLATEIFCRVFERPSIPHLDRRIDAANQYYNLYHGN